MFDPYKNLSDNEILFQIFNYIEPKFKSNRRFKLLAPCKKTVPRYTISQLAVEYERRTGLQLSASVYVNLFEQHKKRWEEWKIKKKK